MNLFDSIIQNRRLSNLYLWVIVTLLSMPVLGSFIHINIDGYRKAMFNDLINGTAYKPFVYRTLVPLIIKYVTFLFPDDLKDSINHWGNEHISYLNSLGNRIDLIYLLFAILFWYLSIIGFAFIIRKLAILFYPQKARLSFILPIIAVTGIPVLFKYHSYIYDLPHLFLFTLCLYFLTKANWRLYITLLCVTILNKETAVLLIIIFFIHYKKILSRYEFRKLIFVQILAFVIIKLSISIYYLSNPGSVVEIQLLHNVNLVPYSISQFLAFIIIGCGIAYDWKNKPVFLRNSFYIVMPLIILTFFLGYIDEYRDYYELYPIVLLMMAHTVMKLFNKDIENDKTDLQAI